MGAQVSSGTDSKQDYGTPSDFLAAVRKQFGGLSLDLAAHPGNKKAARYFAPARLTMTIEPLMHHDNIVDCLRAQGALEDDVRRAIPQAQWTTSKSGKKTAKIDVANHDSNALAFDSLKQPWHKQNGLLWLNPEFEDIGPWAEKCAVESRRGADILFLVPASVGSVWFRTYVTPTAHIYFLGTRLCFDGKAPYPKDCMLCHFCPDDGMPSRHIRVWDWVNDRFVGQWNSPS